MTGMIGFQDFAPRQTVPAGFLRPAQHEMLQEALAVANGWIAQNNVQVINVETVVLPNIYHPGEQGSTDPELRISGEMSSYWYQIVRVWYRTS